MDLLYGGHKLLTIQERVLPLKMEATYGKAKS